MSILTSLSPRFIATLATLSLTLDANWWNN